MTYEQIKFELNKRFEYGKSAKVYQLFKDLLDGSNNTDMIRNNVIRPYHLTGSGKWIKSTNYKNEIIDLLEVFKIKHKVGNDAPRGGQKGDYIEVFNIPTSRKEKIESIIND